MVMDDSIDNDTIIYSFNLGWAARSSFFWGLKFKVPEAPTWYFTEDLSNFALVVRVFAEVVVVLDELVSFSYLE